MTSNLQRSILLIRANVVLVSNLWCQKIRAQLHRMPAAIKQYTLCPRYPDTR